MKPSLPTMESPSRRINNKKQKNQRRPLPKQKKARQQDNGGGATTAINAKKPSQKTTKRKANTKESSKQSSKGIVSSFKRAKISGGDIISPSVQGYASVTQDYHAVPPSQPANANLAAATAVANDTGLAANNNSSGTSIHQYNLVQHYKGVTFHPRHSKYEAQTNRGYNLGLFDLACDAALAYDVAYRITGGGNINTNNNNNGSQQPQQGMLISNDVEEIKYALNWLDLANDEESSSSSSATTVENNAAAARRRREKKDAVVNFTAPSVYREARGKEIGDYLTGNIHHPTFDLGDVPQEEELKMRIKREILNLARAYVVATTTTTGQQQQGSVNNTTTMNDQRQKSVDVNAARSSTNDQVISDNNTAATSTSNGHDEKKQERMVKKSAAKSGLLKKKMWRMPEEAPAVPTNPTPTANAHKHNEDETKASLSSRQEQAEALLALQQDCSRRTTSSAMVAAAPRRVEQESEGAALAALQEKKRREETKRVALAQKLERIMNGNGGDAGNNGSGVAASDTTSSLPSSSSRQTTSSSLPSYYRANQNNAGGVAAGLTSFATLASSNPKSFALLAAAKGEGLEESPPTKSPEEKNEATGSVRNNSSSAWTKDVIANSNHSSSSSTTSKSDSPNQLQRQALDHWRTKASSFISTSARNNNNNSEQRKLLSPPLPTNNPPPSNQNNNANSSMLERALLLAAQHPGAIDENAVRHAMRDQQSREAAAAMMLRASRMRAALTLSNGCGSDGRQQGQQSRESGDGPPAAPPPSSSPTPAGPQKRPGPVLPTRESRTRANEPPLWRRQRESEEEERQPLKVARPACSSVAVPPPSEPKPAAVLERSSPAEMTKGANNITALLASMGHRGPIPPGLAENLQTALKQQQQQQQQQHQQRGGQAPKTVRDASVVREQQEDDGGEGEGEGEDEDPKVVLQRKMANEAKKAALAQKLSALMSGGGGVGRGMPSHAMDIKQDGPVGLEKVVPHTQPLQGPMLSASRKTLSPRLNASHDTKQGDKLNRPNQDQGKKIAENESEHRSHDHQGDKAKVKDTLISKVAPLTTKSANLKSAEAVVKQPQPQVGNVVPENIASSISTRPLQQPSFQALQALQNGLNLPGEQGSLEGIDEQALLQSLLLKKQMAEMNKKALEQKVQDYIQGKTGGINLQQQAQPRQLPSPSLGSPPLAGLNQEQISRQIALQSFLSQNSGAATRQQSILGQQQPQLSADHLARQSALQTILAANQRRRTTTTNNCNPINDALTHDVVQRRLVIESMLMSEENRLRQLREALQNPQQQCAQPSQLQHHQLLNQLGGVAGAGFVGIGHNQFNGGGVHGQFNNAATANPHHELMRERERAAASNMANDDFRKAMLTAEINASTAEQRMQENALRQALAQRASQGAEISPERLLEAARNHGLDPQTMTPGQLAQLMGMVGRG